MSTLRSQDEIRNTAVRLGLPEHPFFMRRTARAFDLVDTNKVNHVTDDIFRVHSQYDEKFYTVELDSGLPPRCTCADFQKHGLVDGAGNGHACKHIIASFLVKERRGKQSVKVTWDDTENSYMKRGRWWVTDYKRKVKYIVYRDGNGRFICPCGKKKDCEHRKAIREYLSGRRRVNASHANNGNGNGSKITNECGSEHAKALQDKLNGQLNSQNNNGNGGNQSPSQPTQLDISDPFQEAEQLDIDQIEGRLDGELVHRLSLGEYVISYKGIMTLAEKHNIEFSVSLDDDTNTVIAKAMNGNSRVSGKEVNICGKAYTASELAKRNAARQLLPLVEIKAMERKAKLNAEFDWQKAKSKCVELVLTSANVDIIIHELVKDGKLRQDNPSHYDRTEWLIIHDACKQDASDDNNDGGDDAPSSGKVDPDDDNPPGGRHGGNDDDGNNDDGGGKKPSSSNDEWRVKLQECKDTALNAQRFDWLKSDLQHEGVISDNPALDWQDSDFETLKQACALDTSLFNRSLGDDFHIQKERNWGGYESSRRYRFWIVTKDTNELREKCFCCRRRFITNHNHGKTRSQSQLSDDIIHWERYYIKTVVCSDCIEAMTKQDLTKRFRELYHNGNGAVNTDGLPKPSEDFINQIDSVLNKRGGNATPSERELPHNADDFVNECKEVTDSVNDDDTVEANEQPLEGLRLARRESVDSESDNGHRPSVVDQEGKRKLQMDKKLRTWLIETDGTKKEISCREICEKFEGEKNPNIVTRLRAGIDSGADLSTVELDD